MALLGRSPLRMESVSISTRASYSPYSAWKCAGLWSLKYIRTTIPKNRDTSGIPSFDFTYSASTASEAASARGNPEPCLVLLALAASAVDVDQAGSGLAPRENARIDGLPAARDG